MKKIVDCFMIGGICMSIISCQKTFIDLNPTAQFTDAAYFKQPGDFKAYATSFYNYYDSQNKKWVSMLPGWDFGNMDNSTDLSANANSTGYDLGHGTIAVGSTSWDYSGVRSCNILLSKASAYKGTGDVSQFVGEAYFFRAFAYFGFLKRYGGVPVDTTVLDVNSPELYAPRNSRYQVVTQIL